MPSKYRRIAVVEDPELERALERAAGKVPHRSRASLLRELAIIGSGRVAGEPPESALDYLMRIPGARGPKPGAGGIKEFLEEHSLGPVAEDDPYALTRALEEQRAERL